MTLLVQERKGARERADFVTGLREAFKLHTSELPDRLYPSFAIVTQGFLQDHLADKTTTSASDEDHFSRALGCLLEELNTWRRLKQLELLDIMKRGGLDRSPDSSEESDRLLLSLATTFFSCSRSPSYHSYGHVFNMHMPHLSKRACCKPRDLWDVSCLRYSHDAAEVVGSLVIAAGLDPQTASAHLMDQTHARFLCLSCPRTPRTARHWVDCVRHYAVQASEQLPSLLTGWLI